MAPSRSALRSPFRPDLSLVLVIAMFALLWVMGGASRAETLGQVFVRAGSWLLLVLAILFGPRPAMAGVRPVVILLCAAVALPLLQLVPLPPAWWQSLPGRDILNIPGEPVIWRPWTMAPGATRNALASLIVPAAMLVLLTQASERTRSWLPTILLVMIAAAVLLGLLQFSGAGFNSPFLNDTPGQVSAIFANRNHLALFVALGCLIAPVWAFLDQRALKWRGPMAAALVLLFVLTILATGSRSGMFAGALALALALAMIGRSLRRRFAHLPAWVLPTLIVAAAIVLAGFVWLSFIAERADSIDRLLDVETGTDMRRRALPVVISMIQTYMPFGSGMGGFDPVFRIHEPANLLKFTYFNQAHNDFLGVALDGGLPGVLLLAAAILWWLLASIRVVRTAPNTEVMLARLGSAIIFLILVASLTDYPARTPTIMAVVVLAAFWLARGAKVAMQAALPKRVIDL